MIKDVDTLKELILWAKSNKVKSLKVADIHVEMSDYAFIADLVESQEQSVKKQDLEAGDGLSEAKDEDESKYSDDDLFHSAR